MKTIKTLLPGEPGTKSAMNKYGEKLIYVRYRLDKKTRKKYKTVELIEDEIHKKHEKYRIPMNKIIGIHVHIKEHHLRKIVKAAGGKWDFKKKVWLLPYQEIKNLGLEDRIVFEN